jgi:hypothetical protein
MALCPHCRHAVSDPPAGLCPNCGGDLRAPAGASSAPRSSAPEGPPAPSGPGPGIAWEQRDRLGFFNALVETTRQVLLEPATFFRSMPVTGGLGSPLLYGVVLGWAGLVATSFYQAIFRSVVGAGWAGLGADRPEVEALLGWVGGWAGFVGQVVFGPIAVAIGMFVAAGILHLILLLLGGARRGFEATFRVVGFAEATSLLFLVPFCGQLLGWLWCAVLYVLGLAAAHQIGQGKAAAAVLLPIALCCCGVVVLAFLFGAAIASFAGHMP